MKQKRRSECEQRGRRVDCPVTERGGVSEGNADVTQPQEEHPYRRNQHRHGSKLQISHHRNAREQIAHEDNRIQKSVITEIIGVLPSPELERELRQKFAGLIEGLPIVLGQHAVLADPVRHGTEQIGRAGHAENHRKQHACDSQKDRKIPLSHGSNCLTHGNNLPQTAFHRKSSLHTIAQSLRSYNRQNPQRNRFFGFLFRKM